MSKLTPCSTATRLRVEFIRRAPARRSSPYPARPADRSGAAPARRGGRSRRRRRSASCRGRGRRGSPPAAPDRPPRSCVGSRWRTRIASTSSRSAGASERRSAASRPRPDRLAVAVAPVPGRGLDRVADRVAEVEDVAPAAVALVGGDHLALVAGAGEDHVVELDRIERFDQPHPLPERAAGEQARLQHLDEPGRQLRQRQRRQASRCRRRRAPAAGMRRRSSCPRGRSTPVLPP